MYGIVMYGDFVFLLDFVLLLYVNLDVFKGGLMVIVEVGGYDSLNFYVLKGCKFWQFSYLISESFMGRLLDELFFLYGLLVEMIEIGLNCEWVEFILCEEVCFFDGSFVIVEDVIWLFEIFGIVGYFRYYGFYGKIEIIEKIGDWLVWFIFNEDNCELVLLVGLWLILKWDMFDGVDFVEEGLLMIFVILVLYVIIDYEYGLFIELICNFDYWGVNVLFCVGIVNFDMLWFEFFVDEVFVFEVFKMGEINFICEFNQVCWVVIYDFLLVQLGDVVKVELIY